MTEAAVPVKLRDEPSAMEGSFVSAVTYPRLLDRTLAVTWPQLETVGAFFVMSLATLKPRLTSMRIDKVPMLQAKAGTTEMERGRAWMAKRHRVAANYNYMCAKCGSPWVSSRDQIDHIVPREQGGSNDESNLQPLCNEPCHAEKTAAEARARSGR